ncbi:MAG: ankyrin repeat domain-containing protein [Verrucomicrobiota bacterium]|jgi:ankyrin repeat protein|nr:ankyrin repeat domain-containing protein [Verrucomicrobiota bacterium]
MLAVRYLLLVAIIVLILTGCKSPIQNDIVLSNQQDALVKVNAYSLRQLNQIQGLGLTILHTAVIANDIQIVKALINRKVNLDVKTSSLNNSGLTALHIAVQSESPEMVKVLLSAGADHEIKFKDLSALDFAKIANNNEIIELLINHNN